MDAGMAEYLIKPVTFNNLANLFNKFIINWIKIYIFVHRFKKHIYKIFF